MVFILKHLINIGIPFDKKRKYCSTNNTIMYYCIMPDKTSLLYYPGVKTL